MTKLRQSQIQCERLGNENISLRSRIVELRNQINAEGSKERFDTQFKVSAALWKALAVISKAESKNYKEVGEEQ